MKRRMNVRNINSRRRRDVLMTKCACYRTSGIRVRNIIIAPSPCTNEIKVKKVISILMKIKGLRLTKMTQIEMMTTEGKVSLSRSAG